jgi:hypothetical protein
MTFLNLSDRNTISGILVSSAAYTIPELADDIVEPIESELAVQVEYDMDEQGQRSYILGQRELTQ